MGADEIWLSRVDGTATRPLGQGVVPIWTADDRIIYRRGTDLWWVPANGSEEPRQLTTSSGAAHAPGVVGEDGMLIFHELDGPPDLLIRSLAEGAEASH